MRVLVTGAAGFIGQHLWRALITGGHEPRACDKRWGTETSSRVWLNFPNLDGVDLIVHLGAQASTAESLRDPAGDFVDNALGTVHVAEAAHRAGGVPILFVSTCKVRAGRDGLLAPLGLSKLVGEYYLELYRALYGLRSVVLQPSTVYGPGQDGSADLGWVTWFARAALTGQRIVIAGDGSQSRDILYIDDFVALLVDIVEHFDAYHGNDAEFEPYEVGGGPENVVSLRGLLAELEYTNFELGPRPPGDLDRVESDNVRISAVRGWRPSIGWRDGLARTLEWLKEVN